MSASQFIIGLIIIALGVLLLLGNIGFADTSDIFRWFPSLFILLGIFLIIKNRFRRVGGPIFMIIVAAIIQIIALDILNIFKYWPIILVAIGILILIKSFGSRRKRESVTNVDIKSQDTPDSVSVFGSAKKVAPPNQDSINSVSVLGSAAETIASHEFRGGQATAVMGESSIDLRESSVSEKPAALEIYVVMGEMKIQVPGEWNVRLDGVTIVMGESKDERIRKDAQNDQTDLALNGTVVMGSLKIEN